MDMRSCGAREFLLQIRAQNLIGAAVLAATLAGWPAIYAATHYTDRQLDALAERVGRSFWIQDVDGRTPLFLSTADATASTFRGQTGESFEIVELVRGKTPYYKVRFASGKVGYLPPRVILEELNSTILMVDPLLYEKRKAAEQAEEEKKRLDWIEAQPWPAAAKEAARDGNPVPGMNAAEVRKITGTPSKVVKTESHGTIPEEHWIYADGRELVFQRGLLVRIARSGSRAP
jgi:hypothetical protein